jgi:3-oxoacid CoA-transferase subunit A
LRRWCGGARSATGGARGEGLHTISNNMGVDGFGMGLMLEAGMIASHTGSYRGGEPAAGALVLKRASWT